MMPVYKKLLLDVNTKSHDIIVAVQGDALSRYLDVVLMDGASPIDLTGCEVRIYGKKFDDTEFYNDGVITEATNGRCQFELTSQALAVANDLEANIMIFQDNVKILSTPVFVIHVVKSLFNNEAIESSNEYGALVVLYQNLYESYDLMTQMITKIGVPEANAIALNLDTMFEVWDYLIQYLVDNSSAGIVDVVTDIQTKIGTTTNTGGTATTGTVMGKLNALVLRGGAKSIQRGVARGVSAQADTVITIATINAMRAMVLLDGTSGRSSDDTYAPYLVALTNNSLSVRGSGGGAVGQISWQVIEYY